jgi:hypothetical protein
MTTKQEINKLQASIMEALADIKRAKEQLKATKSYLYHDCQRPLLKKIITLCSKKYKEEKAEKGFTDYWMIPPLGHDTIFYVQPKGNTVDISYTDFPSHDNQFRAREDYMVVTWSQPFRHEEDTYGIAFPLRLLWEEE